MLLLLLLLLEQACVEKVIQLASLLPGCRPSSPALLLVVGFTHGRSAVDEIWLIVMHGSVHDSLTASGLLLLLRGGDAALGAGRNLFRFIGIA